MLSGRWFVFVALLWLPPVAGVALFVHAWSSGALWRPALVGAWCGVGVALIAVSVGLSPRISGAYWAAPVNVLAGPLSFVWLAGQMVCIGVVIYLAFRLRIR
jgi:hypothetical protein